MMNQQIYQTIPWDGRAFNFLKGWTQATGAEITAVFEPVIDIIMALRPPPPGDYFFVGCAAKTSVFQTPSHDVPRNSVCACGVSAASVQQEWVDCWNLIGLPPKDNLVLYNIEGIMTNRITTIQSDGWPESAALFVLAAELAHELYHVKYHQKLLHDFEGEREAFEVQRDFLNGGATLFLSGIDPRFKEAWLQQSRQTERDAEKEWRDKHPLWRPSAILRVRP